MMPDAQLSADAMPTRGAVIATLSVLRKHFKGINNVSLHRIYLPPN
jgi:hypothetical protein